MKYGFCAVPHAEFLVDVSEVKLDGELANEELACDLFVRKAVGNKPKDLALSPG